MPLDTTNFHPQGPVKSVDMLQFYNLFTGVMTDQPVTFSNTLTLGGNQSVSTVPLRVYGAPGQNTNLIDLYADKTQPQPGFGFSATGRFAWGPGGGSAQDTFMSRIATQNGHGTDTAGLFIVPALEIGGSITATSYQFANGATLTGPVGTPNALLVTQDLTVNRYLYLTNTNERLYHTVLPSINIESQDGYAILSGKITDSLSVNAYYDGANWQRWDAAQPSTLFNFGTGGLSLMRVAAAAGAITGWGTPVIIADSSGNLTTAGWMHATGLPAGYPTGVGLELYYDGSQGVVQSYNRSTSAFLTTTIVGSTVNIVSNGHTASFDTAGGLTVSGGLAVTGAASVNSNLNVSGTITGGNFTSNAAYDSGDGHYYFAHNAGIYWYWDGTSINSSHGIASGANVFYFAGRASNISWDGSWVRTSGGAGFGTSGTTIWMANDAGKGISWDGTYTHVMPNMMSNAAIYMNANGGVYLNWDGTNIQHSQQISVSGRIYGMAQWGGALGNNNVFLAPNIADNRGQSLAQSWGTWSSGKHKRNVRPIGAALSLVRDDQLRGVYYDNINWRVEPDDESVPETTPSLGFIAEDWLERVPEIIIRDPQGEAAGMDYSRVAAILWEAVKALDTEVRELKRQAVLPVYATRRNGRQLERMST